MATSLKLDLASDTGQPLVWKDQNFIKIMFIITVSGAYVTGGDVIDLTTLFNLLSSAPGKNLNTGALPAKVEIQSNLPVGGTGSAGMYLYRFLRGTTLTNGTLQVLTGAAAQSALTELSAGAYPANVIADVIQGEAWFPQP